MSLWTVNVLGVIKLATLLMITIAGFVVLGGHTKVKDPTANFRNAFEGTNDDAYLLSTALISALFSYSGYHNAFNVVNEIKNPIRTIKRSGTASLLIVAVLYMLVNIAYLAAGEGVEPDLLLIQQYRRTRSRRAPRPRRPSSSRTSLATRRRTA